MWSPHHCYGTWMTSMEPLKGPTNIQQQLTPLSPMTSCKSLVASVIYNKYIIHNFLHLSWHGRHYSNIILVW